MKIALKDIPSYCLHCSIYPNRKKNIIEMCSKLGISNRFVHAETYQYTHQRNVAFDSISLILLALTNNTYPFLILEDDATLIDKIPETIFFPDVADLIYWGTNIYSGYPTTNADLYLTEFNQNYYRIHNSQSGHAILVPNKNSALFLKDIYCESLITNQYHDVLLPNISNKKLFLTPKNGVYFYQNDGKHNEMSKIKWADYPNKIRK